MAKLANHKTEMIVEHRDMTSAYNAMTVAADTQRLWRLAKTALIQRGYNLIFEAINELASSEGWYGVRSNDNCRRIALTKTFLDIDRDFWCIVGVA